jgi:Ca-activated chloride channel family protein
MPLWLGRYVPWALVALWVGIVAVFLRESIRRVQIHRRPALLGGAILGGIFVAYMLLVWGGLVPDRYVRIDRPAGVLATWVASWVVAWRLASWTTKQTAARRAVVDATAMLATLLCGSAIAGIDIGKPLDRLTILVAVDRSRSIDLVPGAEARIRTDLQAAELTMRDGDRIGTIVFASQAATEDPPRPRSELPAPQRVELGRDGTDLGAAIRRALAEVPPDSAARIVLISDGVSNRGDPVAAAAAAVAAGVPVDNVPLDQETVADVRVVAVRMPTRANEGETIELRLVTAATSASDVEIRIKRDGELIAKTTAKVEAGEDVLRIKQKSPGPGLHRYDVEVSAIHPEQDRAPEDNSGTAFIRVRGPATALVLEGEPGKGAFIDKALRDGSYSVTTGTASAVPADVGGFALYDVIFLSDIPAHALSPTQIEAFASYVRDLGGGLVLMGGDKSLGPGGYAQTPIEEVSPVSFDIKQDRRRASLAEVILIDYSGSMAASAGKHTKLDLANEASVRSAALLGPGDRLGVAHVDTAVSWTIPLGPVTDQKEIEKKIRAVGPGGGGIYTDLALSAGYAALDRERVNLKHALLFADGSDAEQLTGCRTLVTNAKRRGITTSVVALGRGSDVPELEVLSKLGDGRFYLIEDANRLPAVFTQETILASRSAINEVEFRVSMGAAGPPTRGIDFSLSPALRGYVVTIPKARTSTLLAGPEGDPILATWSVGMGRAAAFTSDLKDRWGVRWTSWPGAASMVVQLARDVTRLADDPRVRLEADTSGGQLHVRAEAVGDDGRAQTFRRLRAHIAGPDGISSDVDLEPTGAGSYTAVVPLSRPGTYVVTAHDELQDENVATTAAALTAGEELRPTGSDRALLARISSMTGGKTRDTLAGIFRDRSSERFAYRSINNWLAALGALLLLASVAARRLSPPAWITSLPSRVSTWLRRRRDVPQPPPGTDPVATLEHLERAKQRVQAAAPARVAQPMPQRPAPVARSAATPPPTAASNHPAPTVSTAASPPATGEPPKPQGRPLTAAEILLQKRRGTRS